MVNAIDSFFMLICAAFPMSGVLGRFRTLPRNLALASLPHFLILGWNFSPIRGSIHRIDISPPKATGQGNLTLLLMYDALSFEDIFDESGSVRSGLAGFAAMQSVAVTFSNAHPPSCPGATHREFRTRQSVTGLIVGDKVRDADIRLSDWTWTDCGGVGRRMVDGETIFADAKRAGNRVHIIGWMLPYLNTFASYVDWGRFDPAFDPVADLVAPTPVRYWLFPGHVRHAARHEEAMKSLIAAVQGAHSDSFVFFHDNLPHFPYPYEEQGQVLSRWRFVLDFKTGKNVGAEGVRRSVQLIDRDLHDLIAAMKGAGSFDGAFVVLLSDHRSHATDRPYSGRIPLLVKLPGQNVPRTVDTRASTAHLRALLGKMRTARPLSSGDVIAILGE